MLRSLANCLLPCCAGLRARPISSPRAEISSSAAATPKAIPRLASLLSSPDLAKQGGVVVMLGAGASVSAGIPDFRSPGTGLYDNLQSYGLPYPEAIFELDFYQRNPRPFQRLCRALWPGNFAPTPTHAFITLLHEKGLLRRCFTQNIDSLETAAGLPKEMVVAAHGNFDAAHVVGSRAAVPVDEVKAAAFGGEAAWDELAARHGGLVKPDIVFYGENLPPRFFARAQDDLPSAALLLVIGTSLRVHPFASLIGATRPGTPRFLLNREKVGTAEEFGPGGLELDSDGAADGFYQGDADDAVRAVAAELGWSDELERLVQLGAERAGEGAGAGEVAV